jgi:hypothetical protein
VTTATASPERAELERSRARMEDNLRLLNDVLARTPIGGRYWFFGGLLLSAVREGEIMLHDTKDADWAFLDVDEERLHASFGALVEAGFLPHLRFPGAVGPATEYSFMKDGAKFEFFKVSVDGDRFVWRNHGHRSDGVPLQNHCAIPAQPLDELRFLDRTWLKARDADVELTALYGDWRTPAAGFDYMQAPTIFDRSPWDNSSYQLWPQTYPVTGC